MPAAGYSVTYSVVDQATKQIDAINKHIQQMRAPLERQARSLQQFVNVSGLRNVATGFEQIATNAFKAFGQMDKVVPVLGTLASAASVAGIVRLAQAFATAGVNLQTSADQIGVTTDQLQRLQDATRLAGGNADDMTASLKGLTEIAAGAFRGSNQDAAAWFNRAGIAIRDANGHLRSTNDLMPEVLRYIQSLANPADRAAASTALLGDANAKLAETFTRSGKSLQDWQKAAEPQLRLTDQQIEKARAWEQATGLLGTAFGHLSDQIGATMATALTPLVNWTGEFVTKHTPAVVGAIDTITNKFPGLEAAASAVLAYFSVRFAAGMIGSIGSITTALGAPGLGKLGAGGAGLLGGLGQVLALTTAISLAASIKTGVDDLSDWAQDKLAAAGVGASSAQTNKLHEQGEAQALGWLSHPWETLKTLGQRIMQGPEAIRRESYSSDVSPEGRALLHTIAGPESGGDPSILYGGGHFTGDQFPQWSGGMGPAGISHAAGRYQFEPATWAEAQQATGVPDFSPASQDKAAWWLAQRDYHKRTGGDLSADLKDPSKAQQIGAALQPTWTSANAGAWAANLQRSLTATPSAAPQATAQATALPVGTVGGAPVNGSLQVTVTHQSPPPGASLAVSSAGQGIDVDPPRVEHQQLSAGG
jgi:muramidase (phage lysozyme)